jgi:hypothetical protein
MFAELFFFWPPFLLHEFSHLAAAMILKVKIIDFSFTYNDELGFPGFRLYLDPMQKVSFFRRLIVGVMPMLIVGLWIVALSKFAFPLGYMDAYILPEMFIALLWLIPSVADIDYIIKSKAVLRGG